jgi:hypothetical protein
MEPWRDLDAHNGGVEAQKMKPCRSVVADSHHFDEEQDPDPDPHLSKKSDLDKRQSAKTDPNQHQHGSDPQQ